MKLLEDKIISDGQVVSSEILKVASFLNHQIDIELLDKMGEEFARLFKDKKVTKILTIEASGIAIACATARFFHVPVVFAKKNRSRNINDDVYCSDIFSFTHEETYHAIVTKKFLTKDDHVLIIDDFLANGAAIKGLIDIISQSGAEFVGAGIAIEKGFQAGGKELREKGYKIESLAIIESMSKDGITFRH